MRAVASAAAPVETPPTKSRRSGVSLPDCRGPARAEQIEVRGVTMKISSHATGIGCALLLSVGTTTVAMAAEGDNIEEVVVTGIRHGIEDAIEIKKGNDSIV